MLDLNGILEELIRMNKRITELESRADRQSHRADGHAHRITSLETEGVDPIDAEYERQV